MSSNNYLTYNHNDIISSLSFGKSNSELFLISSSYDGNIKLINSNTSEIIKSYSLKDPDTNLPLPITTSLFNFNSLSPQIISLTISNSINLINIYKENIQTIPLPLTSSSSTQATTLFNLFQLENSPHTFITPSFNKTIYFLDFRIKDLISKEYKTEYPSETMKHYTNYIISGYRNNIYFYDIRNMNNKEVISFQHHAGDNVSAIEYIDNESVIVGSAEGKIAVEYMNNKMNGVQSYFSFKCHRIEDNDSINAYAVNDIKYYKHKQIFLSAGSDGYVYGWDYVKRKKVFRSKQENNAVSQIALCDDVIALSVCDVEKHEDKNSTVKMYNNINSYFELK